MKATQLVTNFSLLSLRLTLLRLLLAALSISPALTSAQTVEWLLQQGTNSSDTSWDVSADGMGNVYISGITKGNLGGTNAGDFDAFVSKYDDAGNLLWSEQLGTSNDDRSLGVSADGLGNVYISGYTRGDFDGTSAGGYEAFISKYDDLGTLLWTEQLGTTSRDASYGVSADGLGNAYITGYTQGNLGGPRVGGRDAFISKYSASGNLLWSEQLGSINYDESWGVSADGLGNVYISGVTDGNLNGTGTGDGIFEAFVSKYDDSGTLLWTELLGTSSWETSYDVSADGLGNVYITGYTQGSLGGPYAGGATDVFVSKYDTTGNLLWVSQLGSSGQEIGNGVSADGLGNVYITGWTNGSLDGSNAGENDVFVSKFSALGTLLWTEQLGTTSSQTGMDVSADGLGNVYFTGVTSGAFGGPRLVIGDGGDIFIGKISDFVIPEPNSFVLASLATGLLIGRSFQRKRGQFQPQATSHLAKNELRINQSKMR